MHCPDTDGVAVDPVPGEIDLGFDRGARPDSEHPGDRRKGVQVDATPDLRAEGPSVVGDPRRTGKTRRAHVRRDLLSEPEAQMHGSAARVRTCGHAGEQHPCPQNRDGHLAQRRDEEEHAGDDNPPWQPRDEGRARQGKQIIRDREVSEPSESGEDMQGDSEQGLRDSTGHRRREHRARRPCFDHDAGVELIRERADARMIVDVGDAGFGVAFADRRDELSRCQRPAAEREEVAAGALDRSTEDRRPFFGEPGCCRAEVFGLIPGLRERPGQRGPVHLAGGAGRERVDYGDQRHIACGEQLTQRGVGGFPIEGGCGVRQRHVADEHLVASGSALHDRRRSRDAVEPRKGRLDLAELDAATAELDLIVGAADEQETLALETHDIAGAVGTLPSESHHRGELLGIFRGIEVPCEAHTADDQLADLTLSHGIAPAIDDGEIPALERQPDAYRPFAGEERRARDDGRFGGAVGVPDFAAAGDDAGGKFGRAGLAAENDEPHALERLFRPQSGEGRHRTHDRDSVRNQPRTEVDPRPHQRPWGGHERGPISPRQPHLLTGRVERDTQAREYPVAGADRLLLQKEIGLGVDESGGRSMCDGNTLRHPRRPGGEHHPGVIVGGSGARHERVEVAIGEGLSIHSLTGREYPARTDRAHHPRLSEHQARAFFGVVRVDRHVCGAGDERREDRHVEVARPRRNADTHPVAGPHTGHDDLLGAL